MENIIPQVKTMLLQDLDFIDNPSITGQEDRYETLHVDTVKVLKSWKSSLYAFEWLYPDGNIRKAEDLTLRERENSQRVEQAIEKGESLPRPVLGIGILDCIEIGSGRDVFLTLSAQGVKSIPVHISKSMADEFEPYLSMGAR